MEATDPSCRKRKSSIDWIRTRTRTSPHDLLHGIFTRSRSEVFVHRTRSGRARSDPKNSRRHQIELEWPNNKRSRRNSEEGSLESHRLCCIKDLRARRVFSPALIGAEDCYSDQNIKIENFRADKPQFPELELGFIDSQTGGAKEDRVLNSTEISEAAVQGNRDGDIDVQLNREVEMNDEFCCKVSPRADDWGVEQLQTTPPDNDIVLKSGPAETLNRSAVHFLSTNCDENRLQSMIPCDGRGEDLPCRDKDMHIPVENKLVRAPCLRLKLVRNPNSLSYRRLLPFLMDLAKDNSSTLEVLPCRNFPVKSEKNSGQERSYHPLCRGPVIDEVRTNLPVIDEVRTNLSSIACNFDGFEKSKDLSPDAVTFSSALTSSECLSLESSQEPIIKLCPENPEPSQCSVTQSIIPGNVAANHNSTVHESNISYDCGSDSQIVHMDTSENCFESIVPENDAGNCIREIEVPGNDARTCIREFEILYGSPSCYSIDYGALSLNVGAAVDQTDPSYSLSRTAEEESATSLHKSGDDIVLLRPPEIKDVLQSSLPVPFEDRSFRPLVERHHLPPAGSHPDAKVESPSPASLDFLQTDCSLSQVEIPVILEKAIVAPTKGILKSHLRECKGLCTCTDCISFRLRADEAHGYARKLMQDAEEVAMGLMKELLSLRSLMEKFVTSMSNNDGVDAVIRHSQIKGFCKRASNAEEFARKRLMQMTRDLNIRSRINCMQQQQQRPLTPRVVKFSDYVQEKLIPKDEEDC